MSGSFSGRRSSGRLPLDSAATFATKDICSIGKEERCQKNEHTFTSPHLLARSRHADAYVSVGSRDRHRLRRLNRRLKIIRNSLYDGTLLLQAHSVLHVPSLDSATPGDR